MKSHNFRPNGKWNLSLAILFTFLFILGGISCRKNNSRSIAAVPDLPSLSQFLDGELISGSVKAKQEEEGLLLFCNDGRDIFLLEKTSSASVSICVNIKTAVILYSKFGIIVKDAETNKIWVYVNNDPESMKKFETAGTYNQPNTIQSTIFGHIRVRCPKV